MINSKQSKIQKVPGKKLTTPIILKRLIQQKQIKQLVIIYILLVVDTQLVHFRPSKAANL
jgi:hypothetical protein